MEKKSTIGESASSVCYKAKAHARERDSVLAAGFVEGEVRQFLGRALPKPQQTEVVERLSAMMYANSRSGCERKRDEFVLRFKKTDPRACATLVRDWERLVTFDLVMF